MVSRNGVKVLYLKVCGQMKILMSLRSLLSTANGINALNKIRKYYGEQTIPTSPVDVDGMPSNDELYELVADPKYKTDPDFS